MFLCIDLGSTSFKAAVYDCDLNVLGSDGARLDYAQLNERVELEPETVSDTVQNAVQGALKSAQLRPEEITAAAVTSQAQTFALRMDKQFVTPMISWQDSRGEPAAASMKTDPVFDSFREHTSFYAPAPGLMLCLLTQVFEDHPEFVGGDVVPLPSYVMEQLTGQRVLDENLAAMSGLWSLPEKKWNEVYLQRLGVTPAQLPEVGPLPALAGAALAENFLGLPEGCPVYSAGNDQTAGAYAAELECAGGILITLGSAQVVYQWCQELAQPEEGVIRGLYPEGGTYRMVADGYGGNQILRTMKQLELTGFDSFFEQAEVGFAAGAELPSVTPGADRIRWSDESASIAHKCAAVIEFLSERMTDMVRDLRQEGQPVYVTDGGGGRRAVWRQCLERKLGQALPLRIAAPDRGAARMMQSVRSFGT